MFSVFCKLLILSRLISRRVCWSKQILAVFIFILSVPVTFAQAPRDYGDAPRIYDTRPDGAYRPARNANWDGLYMGNSEPDTELSKLEVEMDEDNNGINGDGNDEDGVLVLHNITKRMEYSVVVKVTNHSDAARTLRGWIDFNMNGKFEASEVASVNVPNSIDDGLFTLTWTCAQTDQIPNIASMTRQSLYMRLRISTSTNNNPGGVGATFDRRAFADGDNSNDYTRNEAQGPYFGEVEDYMVYLKEMEPFECTDRTYQTDLNKFYSYSYTGQRFLEAEFCGDINAIGYNVKDGFIWGFDRDNYRLVKIGRNQTIEYYVVPNLPGGLDLFVGDIDTSGYYYLSTGAGAVSYFTIDLNPDRPETYLKLVNPRNNYIAKTTGPWGTTYLNGLGNPVTLPAIADWAINPKDKITYAIVNGNAPAVNTRRTLYSIDFSTGVLTGIGGQVASPDPAFYGQPFGSVFFDSSGVFLVFGNLTGDLFKVDIENQNATRYTRISSPTNNNDGASCALASILPVELMSFSAEQIHHYVELKWSTASEFQNLGFEVQHSKDGLDWEFLDFISSKSSNGNSNTPLEYVLKHHQPIVGLNYYRLKQIDFDGTIEYSKILSVNYNKGNLYSIYPNPVEDYLYVEGIKSTDYLVITNILGAEVKRFYQVSDNISIGDLQSGIYHLILYSEQHNILETFKISKK